MGKLIPGVNDLTTKHPELAKEADGWDPSSLSAGSGKKMPWKCTHNHQWTASVIHRANGRGCPFCSNSKVLAGFNDLKTKHPDLAKEADGWDPSSITPGSVKRLSWKCSKGHVWQTTPNSRTNNLSGCPYCSNKKVLSGFNDLKTKFPEIAKEADGWDPSNVIAGSHKKLAWKCIKGHQWISIVNSRVTQGGRGCPYCSNKKVLRGFNDLKTKFPEIASEADGWDPSEVSSGSGRKVNWKCKEGHIWQSTVSDRARGRKCPYCINKKLIKEDR